MIGSLPPSVTSLRRARAGIQISRPGAISIRGTTIDGATERADNDANEAQTVDTESSAMQNDDYILVNAELVGPPMRNEDIEQCSAPPTAVVSSNPASTQSIVKAELLCSSESNKIPALKTILRNRAVQITLLLACLLMIGLIIAVALGFGTKNGGDLRNSALSTQQNDDSEPADTHDGDISDKYDDDED